MKWEAFKKKDSSGKTLTTLVPHHKEAYLAPVAVRDKVSRNSG